MGASWVRLPPPPHTHTPPDGENGRSTNGPERRQLEASVPVPSLLLFVICGRAT